MWSSGLYRLDSCYSLGPAFGSGLTLSLSIQAWLDLAFVG
jgi:hypothetical protein